MCTVNLSITYMDRRSDNLLWCQFINCQTYTYDICYGIHRSNFMKMYFFYRTAMCMAFCVNLYTAIASSFTFSGTFRCPMICSMSFMLVW